MSHELDREDGSVLTPDREKEAIKPPRQHAVLILNDDFTTMDFVVMVLTEFFNKSEAEAGRIMLDVHQKGKGVAGIYTAEIAETKAQMVCDLAQSAEYPLRAVTQPVD